MKTQTFTVSAIVTLGLIGALGCGGGPGRQTANTTADTYEKVASDAVDQYNLARQNGKPIDQCVQARVVAAAFLRAKDEDSYKIWKETEATDCGAVGMRPQ